jgi:type IV secretion system protein VirB2
MIVSAVIQQASLLDAPPASVVGPAVNWVSGLLFGPLATVIAVIAVAWVGFAMLSGRVDIRRGMTVLLGCFLLFGARDLANGLKMASSGDAAPAVSNVPPPPVYAEPVAPVNPPNGYDPYAGASVLQNR